MNHFLTEPMLTANLPSLGNGLALQIYTRVITFRKKEYSCINTPLKRQSDVFFEPFFLTFVRRLFEDGSPMTLLSNKHVLKILKNTVLLMHAYYCTSIGWIVQSFFLIP
jgi:hypothetical protein